MAENVHKYMPKSVATAKGYLDQTQKNQHSTKPKTLQPDDDDGNDIKAMPPITDRKCMYYVYAAIISAPSTSSQIYTNQMGHFPVQSWFGNKYITVLYDYDSNCILAEPMKNCTDAAMIGAYQTHYNSLVAQGLEPRLQKLDNKASKWLKQFITKVEFQLVWSADASVQCGRASNLNIQNHFIAGLCSTDKLFPMNLWDQLLPQAVMTLNLLCAPHINLQPSPHMHSSKFTLISMPLHWLQHPVHKLSFTKSSWSEHCGPHMGEMDGTWAQQWSTTAVTQAHQWHKLWMAWKHSGIFPTTCQNVNAIQCQCSYAGSQGSYPCPAISTSHYAIWHWGPTACGTLPTIANIWPINASAQAIKCAIMSRGTKTSKGGEPQCQSP